MNTKIQDIVEIALKTIAAQAAKDAETLANARNQWRNKELIMAEQQAVFGANKFKQLVKERIAIEMDITTDKKQKEFLTNLLIAVDNTQIGKD